jgi:hypothetical protein
VRSFNVVHHDGAVRVQIDDDGTATLVVEVITDTEVVVRAINQAVGEGAVRSTMFTGDVVNDQIAKMHRMRAETGTTWLGGKVTLIEEGELGPRFRIDWEVMPSITEEGD